MEGLLRWITKSEEFGISVCIIRSTFLSVIKDSTGPNSLGILFGIFFLLKVFEVSHEKLILLSLPLT